MIGTSSFPSPHKTTHYTGGSDALTPSDISALALSGGTLSGNLAMNGTANTAPNQTAASGSSVMTRDLVDARVGHYTSLTSFLFRDYFQGGAQTSGTIGTLGWSSNAPTIGAVAATATERGGVIITTGATSGNSGRLLFYPAPYMTDTGTWVMTARIKLSSVSNLKLGLGYSNTVGITCSSGVIARFDSSVDTYWTLITPSGTQASSTSPTTNWMTISIRSVGGTQYISFDGGAETSLVSTRGNGASGFMFYIETAEAATKSLSANFFEMSA